MEFKVSDELKRIAVALLSGLILAVGLNFFLIPGNIFASGFNGIAQLLSSILNKMFQIKIDTGYFILLLNIPIGILGWIKVGRNFTYYSVITIISTTFFAVIIPVQRLTPDPLMSGLFGGVLTGVGIGASLRYGFSTGGMDIIAVILNKTTGKSVGFVMLVINMFIILTAGFFFGWQSALYTIISNYAMTRVIDGIHTSHQKLTAFVVTNRAQHIIPVLSQSLVRGVTIMPSKGGYSGEESQVLMIVITRYELYRFKQIISQEDPLAFVNFVNTADISGNFFDEEQQAKISAEAARSHRN
ncbi:membrane protein [Liquorilactobacillus sucicola DSM 21376 = JCM 15457]|uniref:DUF2179 domain-containing protein n=1 Tax=Liquorilactobacillus sucicola DSM 21376 = JCM 15457 TaxID=1423806 RepID=A0A023CWB7_9LACO|nr:YitT family protein [Liquorilactobacillus sucicola]KRN06185.1 hypothetical protein FD15_GL001381 [Liquorilactobacillus sucicola DSM 21376 = JCM 15457]GAJ26114.1 membrane protein [Liquorilactobacillus sucicola DSM 21376 = JCM 15457]